MGKMAQKIPQNRFSETITWLFPLIGADDQENMTRIYRQVLPEQAFAQAISVIRLAIGDRWEELTRRIPELK